MHITHLGHACVLVEVDDVRVLIDPGAYSDGFEELEGIDLILISHVHADHYDAARVPALFAANPDAIVAASAAVATALPAELGVTILEPGTSTLAGVQIETTGSVHAVIHPLLPNVANSGYVIAGRVWHPGDSFDHPQRSIDILLLPVGGPWMRLADAIDFERSVAPTVSIPIHEAGLSPLHQKLHYQLLTTLAPTGTQFLPLERGITHEF